MLEQIAYTLLGGGAVIYRVFGTGEYVQIPKTVDGYEVTGLWDHCFAAEPSVRVRESSVLVAKETSDGPLQAAAREMFTLEKVRKHYPAMCRDSLKEIVLPRNLQFTGDYAFYGCQKLEYLTIPASLRRLGGGNFVACNHLKVISFETEEKEGSSTLPFCYVMKDVLGEVTYEVEARLTAPSTGAGEERVLCRLVYPGYYEDSKENTPARIIEIKFEGMGYPYRQCFRGREVDLRAYDELFNLTCAQELLPTTLALAVCRLETPVVLDEEHKARYVNWLKDNRESTLPVLLEMSLQDSKLFRVLEESGFFTAEIVQDALRLASEKRNVQAVSYLMALEDTMRRPKSEGCGSDSSKNGNKNSAPPERRRRYTFSSKN